jgi:beta-RFAP synthase
VHAREAGGFIWDAGHRYPPHKASMEPSSASGAPPAQRLLSLHPNWLKVVHFRFSDRGLHGLAEKRFFEVNCPVDPQETTALLALVAGSFLPSLIEADDAGVQAAVAAMQELGLKRLEWRTQDRETLAFRDFWRSQTRSAALGLTSLGPTLYCLTKDPTSVMEAVRSYGKAPLSIAVSDLFDPSTAG